MKWKSSILLPHAEKENESPQWDQSYYVINRRENRRNLPLTSIGENKHIEIENNRRLHENQRRRLERNAPTSGILSKPYIENQNQISKKGRRNQSMVTTHRPAKENEMQRREISDNQSISERPWNKASPWRRNRRNQSLINEMKRAQIPGKSIGPTPPEEKYINRKRSKKTPREEEIRRRKMKKKEENNQSENNDDNGEEEAANQKNQLKEKYLRNQ